MKGIIIKRKAFHDQIRNQQIQRFFSEKREKIIASFSNSLSLRLQVLLTDVPSSFFTINQQTSELNINQQQILLFLRKNCKQLVQRCRNTRLGLQQWIQGMQVLIKMINSCQSSLEKRQIVQFSEDIFCRKGTQLLQSNKVDKYQILLMIMEYYTAIIKKPSFLPFESCYQKMAILELIGLNWKSKNKQFLFFLRFLNLLLEKAIEVENLSIIYELFISESKVILKMFKILQDIYQFHSIEQYQPLIVSILRILINITYAIRDQKLSQILMITSFREFILSRLNSKEQMTGKQLYLQLVCNIMVDQPKFTEFIKQNMDIYVLSHINEVWKPLVDDIKSLCWPHNHY